MAVFPHGSSYPSALVLPLDAPFFVTGTPENDTRMVTVPFNHPLEKTHVFFVHSRQAVFLNHQDTQFITGIQHLGSHRIMARTIGIGTHLLQLSQAEILQGIRNTGSYPCMVLMHIEAFQLHCLTIQQETLVGMELDVADAGTGGVHIHLIAVLIHLRTDSVQVRILRIPKDRIFHHHPGQGLLLGFREDMGTRSFTAGHFLSLGIQQYVSEPISGRLQAHILHGGLYRQLRPVERCLHFCIHKRTEGGHMHGRHLVEPHMAIDAGSFVEPSFFQGSIGTYRHQVLLAIVQILGNIVHLGRISARLVSQVEAVHPHSGIAEDTVEL